MQYKHPTHNTKTPAFEMFLLRYNILFINMKILFLSVEEHLVNLCAVWYLSMKSKCVLQMLSIQKRHFFQMPCKFGLFLKLKISIHTRIILLPFYVILIIQERHPQITLRIVLAPNIQLYPFIAE